MPPSLQPSATVHLASSILTTGDSTAIGKIYMPTSIIAVYPPHSSNAEYRMREHRRSAMSQDPVNGELGYGNSIGESKQQLAIYVRHMRLPHKAPASFLPELDVGAAEDCRQGAATSFLPFGEAETLIPRGPSVNTSSIRLLGALPPSPQRKRQQQTAQAELITSHSPNSWHQKRADRTGPSRIGHWKSPKGQISASRIPNIPRTLNAAKASSRQITTADSGARDESWSSRSSWSRPVQGGLYTRVSHPDEEAYSAPSTAALYSYYDRGLVDPEAPLAPLDVLAGFCDERGAGGG